MTEAYYGGETAEPPGGADDAGAAVPDDTGTGPASADASGSHLDTGSDDYAGYSDADIEAFLAAEDQLPEPRTRQEAAADARNDSPDDPAGSDPADEFDGDVAEFLAAEDQFPEPMTRQEAAAATWDDVTQPGDDDPDSFSGDPAPEYDGDVAAFLASEEQLPEPRTRQEAAAATWDDGLGTSTGGASVNQPDTVSELPAPDSKGAEGTGDPYEHQVAVHSGFGTEVPITVEQLPPAARTIGDTTPTGIGRKPTGEELPGMEPEKPTKPRLDRLFDEALKEGDDFSDAAGSIGAAFEADLHGPGPSGHGGSHHATTSSARDHPASSDPGVNDAVSSMAIVGLVAAVAIRRAISELWKERKP